MDGLRRRVVRYEGTWTPSPGDNGPSTHGSHLVAMCRFSAVCSTANHLKTKDCYGMSCCVEQII